MEYSSTLSENEIKVSTVAGEQLQRLISDMEDDDIEAIRIYVAGGGCSGMTYGMDVSRIGARTTIASTKGRDIASYVDAVALNYLSGVEIDFVTRETGSTFVFNNVFPGGPAAQEPAARAAMAGRRRPRLRIAPNPGRIQAPAQGPADHSARQLPGPRLPRGGSRPRCRDDRR